MNDTCIALILTRFEGKWWCIDLCNRHRRQPLNTKVTLYNWSGIYSTQYFGALMRQLITRSWIAPVVFVLCLHTNNQFIKSNFV